MTMRLQVQRTGNGGVKRRWKWKKEEDDGKKNRRQKKKEEELRMVVIITSEGRCLTETRSIGIFKYYSLKLKIHGQIKT